VQFFRNTTILLAFLVIPSWLMGQRCVVPQTTEYICPADNCSSDVITVVTSYGAPYAGTKDIVSASQCGSSGLCSMFPGTGAEAASIDTLCPGGGGQECDPTDPTSCASGYTCDPNTSQCIPNGPSNGSSCSVQNAKCSADSDCCPALTCQSGQCEVIGPSCTTDSQCPTGEICDGQECTDPVTPPCYNQCDSTCVNYDPSACSTPPGNGSGGDGGDPGGGDPCVNQDSIVDRAFRPGPDDVDPGGNCPGDPGS
jgi:hypothetical protein